MTCPGQSERSQVIDIAGAPEEIRTPDPQIRSLVTCGGRLLLSRLPQKQHDRFQRENVHPSEVENMLGAHEHVKEVGVIGARSEKG